MKQLRNLSFFSPCLFCGTQTKPRASPIPGKHPIGGYISSLALCYIRWVEQLVLYYIFPRDRLHREVFAAKGALKLV